MQNKVLLETLYSYLVYCVARISVRARCDQDVEQDVEQGSSIYFYLLKPCSAKCVLTKGGLSPSG